MASDWMFHCGLDDDSDGSHMSKRKARRIRDVSRKSHGGYVYDYNDRKAAEAALGNEYWE